jgi:hypothetical protein
MNLIYPVMSMTNFVLGQYRLYRRVGFGRRKAIKRALSAHRQGF